MSDRLRFPKRGIRRLKTLPILPTLFTAGNLACGVTAIMCAASGELIFGCILIFIAMVCDMFDGKMARLTGTEGEFGAELDSLADIVSFGVAPALLVHRLAIGVNEVWIEPLSVWIITIAYPVFTAMRLARYNVEHSDDACSYFKGLPSPGAAAVLCAWIFTYNAAGLEPGSFWDVTIKRCILGMMLFLSALMVSNVKFPHLGNTLLAGRTGFRKFMFTIAIIITIIYFTRIHSMTVLCTTYILYGCIPGAVSAIKRIRSGHSLLDDDDEEDEAESDNTDGLEKSEGVDEQRA